MPEYRSKPIPAGFGIDPTLSDIFENNRLADAEEREDIRKSMRAIRGDMAELRGQAIRQERMSTEALNASRETLGYCRAVADKVLEHFQYTTAKAPQQGTDSEAPPMRGKLPTHRDLARVRDDAENSSQHLITELEQLKANQKVLEEEIDTRDREALEARAKAADDRAKALEDMIVVRDRAEAKRLEDERKAREDDEKLAKRERSARIWAVILLVISAVVAVVVGHAAWK